MGTTKTKPLHHGSGASNYMTHSYANLLFHLVWSTSGRLPLILPQIKERLFFYLCKIAEDEGAHIIVINGMADHIHILLSLKPTMNLSELIRLLKSSSSKWVKQTFHKNFGWQDGYGAFSVGISTLESVKQYILNQEKHHLKSSFENEFIDFLRMHKIDYDPRFVIEGGLIPNRKTYS